MKKDLYKEIEKVVVNIGVGRLAQDANFKDKILPAIMEELAIITGQRPAPRPAKKSIAGFKVRAGTTVGLKVTIRRTRMKEFLEWLINIVIPRVRDFRGIDHKAIDKQGNLTLGIKDNIVFPEINPEQAKINFGMQITIVLKNIRNRSEALAFYRALKMPLKKGDLKKD